MQEARRTRALQAEREASVLSRGDIRQGTQGHTQHCGPDSGLWAEAEIGDPHPGRGGEALSLLECLKVTYEASLVTWLRKVGMENHGFQGAFIY